MLINKPYFTLRLEMSSCKYTVMVNGAPIAEDLKAQPVAVDIPINHWLRTGRNEISVELYPPDEGQPISFASDCALKLQVHPSGVDSSQNNVISTLHYSGQLAQKGTGTEKSTPAGKYRSVDGFTKKSDGDVVVSEVKTGTLPDDYGTSFTQTVTLTTPFPEWAFFSSDLLPDLYALSEQELDKYFDELYKQYERINDALKRKDIDSILPLFEERSREIDAAFYYEKGRTIKRLEDSLKDAVSNADYELAELKPNYLGFDVGFVNRKMERLERGRGGSAIGFDFKHTTGSENYDLIFRRQNGKWIITR
ncbi:MAG: hypothetical protein GXP08_18785 [Gammaproteobacteria bacterium]|nr:hypothetical protein [Gammaproteobacteria bacterium]